MFVACVSWGMFGPRGSVLSPLLIRDGWPNEAVKKTMLLMDLSSGDSTKMGTKERGLGGEAIGGRHGKECVSGGGRYGVGKDMKRGGRRGPYL